MMHGSGVLEARLAAGIAAACRISERLRDVPTLSAPSEDAASAFEVAARHYLTWRQAACVALNAANRAIEVGDHEVELEAPGVSRHGDRACRPGLALEVR